MYTFDMLQSYAGRCGADVFNIGSSLCKRPILCFHTGSYGGRQIIVSSALHAREHITALLCVKLIDYYKDFGGGIYFIPMANPDGVCLCQSGVDSINDGRLKNRLLKLNGGGDFSLWKANARGVDLNVNFDAGYGGGISNVMRAGSENYIGKHAFSEPETRALCRFTLKVKPAATVSYHCKGEIIYWKFYQKKNLKRDRALAKMLAKETGYKLVGECGSAGGYKDWCIQKLQIPAFTIEVGSDNFSHPFPYEQFGGILKKNKNVLYLLHENL
jgi:g-D-glutamyl-meso-diaminopimelate peptidase